ncbi:MAG: hypothetical protein IKU13_02025 [Clostridia bacterium]|nr:hypothetical protein [Clostridia bacterium]
MNKDVYIICHPSSRSTAENIANFLKKDNIGYDITPVHATDVYNDEFTDIIKSFGVVIAVLSKKAQYSERVLFECNATENLKKTFLPVMAENFTLSSEFNFLLSNVQRFEAFKDDSVVSRELKASIYRALGKEFHEAQDEEIKSLDKKTDSLSAINSENVQKTAAINPQDLTFPEINHILPVRIILSPFYMVSHIFKKDDVSKFLKPSLKISTAPLIACWLLPALGMLMPPFKLSNVFISISLAVLFFIFTYLTYTICLKIAKRDINQASIFWVSFFYSTTINVVGFSLYILTFALLSKLGYK